MEEEADERNRQSDSTSGGGGGQMSGLDALYNGSIEDVARTTSFGAQK